MQRTGGRVQLTYPVRRKGSVITHTPPTERAALRVRSPHPHSDAMDVCVNIPILQMGKMRLKGVKKPLRLVHSKARIFLTSKPKLEKEKETQAFTSSRM